MKNSLHAALADIWHFIETDKVLKPKQKEIIREVINFYEVGQRAVYIEAPTGLGKTVITSQLLRAINQLQYNLPHILVVTPSRKLVEDAGKKFKEFASELKIGLYYTYAKEEAQIIITTYAMLPKVVDRFANRFSLVVFDEAHHILSKRRLRLLEKLKSALWLGLTATPGFSTEKHLNQHFHSAHKTSIIEAIDLKLISGFRNVLVFTEAANLDEIPLNACGEFAESALESALNTHVRNLAALNFYKSVVDPETNRPLLGQSAIINCISINHAKDIASLFCKNICPEDIGGKIPCVPIHGKMSRAEIRRILNDHKVGKILCLAQAKLIGEGHDDVGIKVVLNLKPSLSQVEVPQRGGRALRYDPLNPYANALIVDFVDYGTLTHKLPILFGEIAGGSTYPKWTSTYIERFKYVDVFSDDWSEEKNVEQADVRIPGMKVIWSASIVAEFIKERRKRRLQSPASPAAQAFQQTIFSCYGLAGQRQKDSDWISKEEIAQRYELPLPLIINIFRRCMPVTGKSGFRLDETRRLEWKMEVRFDKNIPYDCLHVGDLIRFEEKYRLAVPPKTKEWLTAGEIAGRINPHELRRIDDAAVRSVFARLKKILGVPGYREDAITKRNWRIETRRHKRRIVVCLHIDDFGDFIKEHYFDAPDQSADYLSPEDLCHELRGITSMTPRSIASYLERSMKQDTPLGKHLSTSIRFQVVCGRPQPCINRNAKNALILYERSLQEMRDADKIAYAIAQREKYRQKRQALYQ